MKGVDNEELAQSYLRGPAFSLFADGVIIAIAGIAIIWPGMGEAWALFGKDFKKHKITIHRETLRGLKWIAAKHGLRRIQAAADRDNPMTSRWLYSLGFKFEGIMPEYWNGKTFSRFGRVFKCL